MELETFFTVQEQTRLFVLACLAGIPLGMLYDGLRILRAVFPHGKISVAAEDILFLLLWSIQLMGFVALFARGELRAFYAVGNLLGFFLYRLTMGNLVVHAVRRVSGAIRRLLHRLFRPLLSGTMHLHKKICVKFVRIRQNTKKE